MTNVASGLLTAGTLELFTAKTRDKLMATSLILFNQRGFEAVTTAAIAERSGVLEGSLWYHFRTKKDLLAAHIELLQKVFAVVNSEDDSEDAAVIINGIFRAYDVIWDFRYLMRDDFRNLLETKDEILHAVQSVNDFMDDWTAGRLSHAETHGMLNFTEDEVDNISEIILMIGRYWMDFSYKKYPKEQDVKLRRKGIKHIFTVLRPFLSDDAIGLIEARVG